MSANIYRINNEVDFNITERTLQRCDMFLPPALLTTPAAKCLELLLRTKSGNIVSHTELYNYAWEKKTKETSPNTLYQTIFQVRRVIATIFNTKEQFILTLPREGFYFNPAVKIELIKVKSEYIDSLIGEDFNLSDKTVNKSTEIHHQLSSLHQILLEICNRVSFIEKLTKSEYEGKSSIEYFVKQKTY